MENEMQAFQTLITQYETEVTAKERELTELKRKLKILKKAHKEWGESSDENNDKQAEV